MAHFGAPTQPAKGIDFFFMKTVPVLPFDFWMLCLREDCARSGKLPMLEGLGDACLRLLWESGALPCALDIIQEKEVLN